MLVISNILSVMRKKILCVLTQILWGAQIVEGKERPHHIYPKELKNPGSTVGFMLILRKNIFYGKDVVFDSGFYVSKGILMLKENGVYRGAFIKKKSYF